MTIVSMKRQMTRTTITMATVYLMTRKITMLATLLPRVRRPTLHVSFFCNITNGLLARSKRNMAAAEPLRLLPEIALPTPPLFT